MYFVSLLYTKWPICGSLCVSSVVQLPGLLFDKRSLVAHGLGLWSHRRLNLLPGRVDIAPLKLNKQLNLDSPVSLSKCLKLHAIAPLTGLAGGSTCWSETKSPELALPFADAIAAHF